MASKKESNGAIPKKIMAHIKSVQQNDKTSKDIIVYNEGSSDDVIPRFQEMTLDKATRLFYDDSIEHKMTNRRCDISMNPQVEKNIIVRQNNDQSTSTHSPEKHEKCLVLETFDKIKNAVMNDDLNELKTSVQDLYASSDKTKLPEVFKHHKYISNTHLIALACEHNRPQILDFLLKESDLLNYLPKNTSKLKKAFCDTVSTSNGKMLEALYDYWSGELHWLAVSKNSADSISNLKLLTKILRESMKNCNSQYPQMIADVQCLMSFNNFQINLYNKLNSLINIRKSEVDAIKDVFLITYKSYIEFTNNFHSPNKDFLTLLDGNNFQNNCHAYLIYDIYYRKMDFNIAIIFLDNLHMLKQRLEMPNNAYQELECSLYYFLYSVIEDWKIYLPEDRPVYKNTITLDTKGPKNYGQFLRMNVPHDPQQIYNAPVLLLERMKFRNTLTAFIETLVATTTERNPLKDKIPDGEINTLTLLPYMRDDYSLKKILKYIKAISKLDFKRDKTRSIFTVQRVIHVIGEFMKNSETGETCHLSPTTKAILQAEIPHNIVKVIEDIRNSFSHTKYGKLIKRIDLETNEPAIFESLIADIYEIHKAITEVIKLYKPILDESRLNSGLLLLEEWEDSSELQNNIKNNRLEHILLNTHNLKQMQRTIKEENIKNILRKLPKYTNLIQHTLVDIETRANNDQNNELNRSDWLKIKNIFEFLIIEIDLLSVRQFPFTLTENYSQFFFGDLDANGIENARKLLEFTKHFYHGNKLHIPSDAFLNKKTEITQILNNIDNVSIKQQKDLKEISSEHVLKNYPNEACIGKNTDQESNINLIKRSLRELSESDNWKIIKDKFFAAADNLNLREYVHFLTTSLENYWKIVLGNPDANGIASARKLLSNISEDEIKTNMTSPAPKDDFKHDFKQIEFLADKMNRNWFLTTEEISYLLKNINFNCKCTAESSNFCAHFHKLAQNIQNNVSLTGTEYKKLKTLNIDDKCQKIVENLVMGYVRDNKMLQCLENRIQHLKDILEGSQDEKHLVLRYKLDDTFRIVIEMIISDVMNIFKDKGLKGLSETVFSKMLSGILIRNVLNHGNPHLEVIGAALDSDYVPSALISFALKLIKDQEYLESLFKLYKDDVDRHDVFCSKNLNTNHMNLVMNFKKCAEWKSYIKLLPTKKQTSGGNKISKSQ